MSQPFPTGGFRWVNIEPNEVNEVGELAPHTDKGYVTTRKMPIALPERRGGSAVANARPKRG